MKHKLTVLACVGLALLLSTGFAFAQPNTITIETKNVNRCSNVSVGINLINADAIDGIGLPLKVTGSTVTAAVATSRLGGWTLVQNGVPGASFLLNGLAPVGTPLLAGAGDIYTLTVPTPSDCSGTIEIDTAFYPPAGAVLLLSGCCPVEFAFNKGVLTLTDQDPICGTATNETKDWHQTISQQLTASDPDPCDPAASLVYSLVSPPAGAAVTAGGLFTWTGACAYVASSPYTITFKVADACGGFCTSTFTVTWTQNGPTCAAVPPQTVHFSSTLNVALPFATDDGCGALAWTLVSEDLVGAISINPTTGLLTYHGNCADIAGSPHVVTYTISDGLAQCQSTVSITVTNTAPTISCSNPPYPYRLCEGVLTRDLTFHLGETIAGAPVGSDADSDPLTYSVTISKVGSPMTPHNPLTFDPATGAYSWVPWNGSPAEAGTWQICFTTSDGCATTEPCCIFVDVVFELAVSIRNAGGTVDTIGALSGDVACVYVNFGPGYVIGGFDLLLAYDQSALTFIGPPVADFMAPSVGWEYFTYRTSANSNCGTGCPSGLLRLVAIANLDNGPLIKPSTYLLAGNQIKLCFRVIPNVNYIDQCIPITFYWVDCGDNTLSSVDGNTTYMSYGVDAACLIGGGQGKPVPIEKVHFCGGWICVRPPIDDRGDINQDGIANTIADAVIFSNYFIYGIDAVFAPPGDRREAQKLASDVNDDGIVLTVADLVYLIRIITGDAQPFPAGGNPKLVPYATDANAMVNVGSDRVTVTANSPVDLGGAVLTFRYSGLTVGTPVLSDAASQMVLSSKADRGELTVLVAPMMNVKGAKINAGTNEIVTIPVSGQGTIELVNVQMADAQGALLNTGVSKAVPTQYALLQNYPNPFNAGTVIQFSLKDQADWTLNVYNITGQTVRTFTGNGQGVVNVAWNGSDNTGNVVASGVYFYRLETKNFTATKKMMLMK